ncbi:MAG: hypothetical protein O2924_03460 [Chloroflexi bacterium]|nr:hypothetical protein [Chloroflexota bacterium]MQC17176.1 hypothetical protein [Chloroflexota bacterium]
MTGVLAALVLLIMPLQIVLSTVMFREPLAAPVLPATLIAAWAVIRRPEETWPAIVLPAIVLGALSEEHVGWFLIALLPAPLIASIAVRRFRPRITGFNRRALTGASAAGAGACLYGLLLLIRADMASDLPRVASALTASAVLSGLLALIAAACLWPLRPRTHGLFE